MYKKRHLEEKIKLLMSNSKVILLTGARQVGKSTLLKNLLPNIAHITFDPVQDLHGAKEDPDLFLQNFPSPIILDEIQYVPNLLSAIKRRVDKYDEKGQYFLTGSQNISILSRISESLAGRMSILNLSNMTIYEMKDVVDKHWLGDYLQNNDNFLENKFLNIPDTESIYKALWRGSYPGFLELDNSVIPELLSSYLQTYIERDVRLIENIKDLNQFGRFVRIVSALTGQEINRAHLGREIGITHTTATKWLNLLEYSYLWHEVPAFSGNSIKQVSKKSKGYLADTGLSCYLQRVSTAESLSSHPMLGALFESYCVNNIKNIANSLNFKPGFYHWRSNGGAEVDLILELNGAFFPIEIKCKSNVTKRDCSGIKAFREAHSHLKIAQGLVIYCGSEIYKIDQNNVAMPWNMMKI